jgi:tetratricopeptide (TPR) repeat protein
MLALDPANEMAHRALMSLFERQGRRGEALRQYRLCVDALQRELGVEPELETRRLYQDIVRAERPAPARPDPRSPLLESSASVPAQFADDPATQLAPLIGRDSELDQLCQSLQASSRGAGRLVVLLGEAGIGKSSLLEAFEAEARRRGVECHLGRSFVSEQVLAFAPWIDALGAAANRDPQLPARLGPAWVDELSRLFPDLAIGSRKRARDPADAQRLFEAVTRFVSCLAGQQPLLIMLEDIHWADEMSLRLLAFVTRRIGSARALVVATAREEEIAGASMLSSILDELAADPRVTRMMVPPLSRDQTATLVRSLARTTDEAAVAGLAEDIFRASQGNPFMVVETMRALAAGTIAVGSGLPDRVRQVIAGRLERLDERSRSLLATAAVIGRAFDFILLRDAAGLDDATAAEEIEALARRRVLRVSGERFDFVHDQVREVVYDQLLPPRRALLHASVALAIERLYPGDLVEQTEQLAHHALRGELWEKAVVYGRQAGHVAAERSASAQAGAHYEDALQALARLPESRQTLEWAIDLRQLRGSHHFALGEREANLRCAEEAVALAERLGDGHWLSQALAFRANTLWFAGENQRALESGTRAAALAEPLGDTAVRIRAGLNLGLICNTVGDFHQAARHLAQVVGMLGGDLERERLGRTLYPAVTARGELARAQAELGQFDAAAATIEEAIRIAETLQHSTSLVVARLDGCHVLLCRGDFHDAISKLEACLESCRAGGLLAWASAAAGMLGYAYAMEGRLADAIPLLREAVDHAAQGRRTREALFVTYLAEALRLARQTEEAALLAERALLLSRQRFERATEARASCLLGEITAEHAGSDASMAERHYRDALALAGELYVRPLVAQCHLGMARLMRRTHDHTERRHHLEQAAAMFRELDMPFWLDQVEAELRAD